jgi:hypothetical protein
LHITRSEEQPTNKFPAWTTLPHTACIHLIACSVEGRLCMLLACQRVWPAFLDGA